MFLSRPTIKYEHALRALGKVSANIYNPQLVKGECVGQRVSEDYISMSTGKYWKHLEKPVKTERVELEHQNFCLNFRLSVLERYLDFSKTYHTRLRNSDYINLTLTELGELEKALENETQTIMMTVPVRVPIRKMLRGDPLNQDDVKLPDNLPELLYNHLQQ